MVDDMRSGVDARVAAGDHRQVSEWFGVTMRTSYNQWALDLSDQLANASRAGSWLTVFDLLLEHPEWINSSRVGGRGYTPLHQAAWHGADGRIVAKLIELGGWRTSRTAEGERPMDIAARRGHHHLRNALTPVIHQPVPAGTLRSIRTHFHKLIPDQVMTIAGRDLVAEHQLRMPELEPLTEQLNPECHFVVPGMYGGFTYRLEASGLMVRSWSRMGGDTYEHHVDERGPRLERCEPTSPMVLATPPGS